MTLTFDASEDELKLFLEEADEQIELLQNETIRLEKEYQDESLVQAIFRAAHTLKGSSAMIGHTRMAELTHALESVLDLVRKGALVPTAEIVDALLTALDSLKILREEVVTKVESDLDLEAVLPGLRAVVEGVAGADGRVRPGSPADRAAGPDVPTTSPGGAEAQMSRFPDPSPLPGQVNAGAQPYGVPLPKEGGNGEPTWLVEVELQPASDWLPVRCFQVLSELKGFGEIVSSAPTADQIEHEQVGPHMRVILRSSADATAIMAAIDSVEEIAHCSVQPYQSVRGVSLTIDKAPVPAHQFEERTPLAGAPIAERRLVDVGPEGRGRSPQQLLELAGQKIDKLSQNIRVNVEHLDKLMNLVGELVIDRNRLHELALRAREKLGADAYVEALAETAQHVTRATDELQAEVMRIRMVPIETVFNRFPRMVRGLAQKLDKHVDFTIEGKETELDRSVVEKIEDPIIHLLRNALDHGVENPEERLAAGKPSAGIVKLSAWQEENQIVIAVEDDGRGIDPATMRAVAVRKGLLSQEAADRLDDQAAIDLLFMPGFSTAAQATDLSGRGVGMDIVRTNIEKLNGFVYVETVPGKGTRFLVKMPLTLAIIRALLVNAGGRKFALPMTSVVETLGVQAQQLQALQTCRALEIHGRVLPVHPLRALLDGSLFQRSPGANVYPYSSDDQAPPDESAAAGRKVFVVAVRAGNHHMGLQVDAFLGQSDIVIKPLSGYLGEIPGLAGVTILGDGRLALICDIPYLLQQARQEQAA